MLLSFDLRIVEGRKCLKMQTERFEQIFFSFGRLHTNSHNFFRCKICTYVNKFIHATSIKVENLNKLEHVPVIPIDQLRTQIASFRQLKPINQHLAFTMWEVDQVLVHIVYCNMLFSVLEMQASLK